MGLGVSDTGGDFTPVPAGPHLAVCNTVVDLGTQHGEYQGKATKAHQVFIGWPVLLTWGVFLSCGLAPMQGWVMRGKDSNPNANLERSARRDDTLRNFVGETIQEDDR